MLIAIRVELRDERLLSETRSCRGSLGVPMCGPAWIVEWHRPSVEDDARKNWSPEDEIAVVVIVVVIVRRLRI